MKRAGESLNDFEFAEREAIGKVRVSSVGAEPAFRLEAKESVGATFQLSPILGFRPPHRDTGFHAASERRCQSQVYMAEHVSIGRTESKLLARL